MSAHSPSGRPSRTEPNEFLTLVNEIEDVSNGDGLLGANRELCLRQYIAAPQAFKVVVQRAIEQATTSPIGMLVWKIKHGEVQRRERALARQADESVPF
jgi:hypothetical protein